MYHYDETKTRYAKKKADKRMDGGSMGCQKKVDAVVKYVEKAYAAGVARISKKRSLNREKSQNKTKMKRSQGWRLLKEVPPVKVRLRQSAKQNQQVQTICPVGRKISLLPTSQGAQKKRVGIFIAMRLIKTINPE